jgi:hypothetical protein
MAHARFTWLRRAQPPPPTHTHIPDFDNLLPPPAPIPTVTDDSVPPPSASIRLDARFAAGRLAPVGSLSTLVVAAFLNPSLLRFISNLATGREFRLVHVAIPRDILHGTVCLAATAAAATATMTPTSVQRNCHCSVAWGALWLSMGMRGYVVLGVFRKASSTNALPYVETNPPLASRLYEGDLLFVVESAARPAS